MNGFQFIKRNLVYFRWRNLFLALGISISAAVITGSLMVGDSVKFSLNQMVDYRLGEIDYAIKSGDRFFSFELAARLSENLQTEAAPVLLTEGVGVAGGGRLRIPGVQVLGVSEEFDRMGGSANFYSELEAGEIILSENLAFKLGLKPGDDILMRIKRTSLIPLNAPFVSDADNIVSSRFTIKAIAGKDELGLFNLNNSQTSPFNAFVLHSELCDIMDFENKSNIILLKTDGKHNDKTIFEAIKEEWTLEDAGIKLEKIEELAEYNLRSERVFFDVNISGSLLNNSASFRPYLSYFVNKLASNNSSTPYSFVSTLPSSELKENEVVINSWLANDLGITTGDSLEMEYFIVGPLRELNIDQKTFIVKSVKAIKGRFADKNLMPDLPGLSDAGNCRDWETGVPIKLDDIRDKDEDYWKDYKGIPKAFISINSATQIWGNRFGDYTGFRISSAVNTRENIENMTLSALNPENLGFKVEHLKESGRIAANNGVNFSELFAGLSFFLLAGGVILTVLLFLLNLEGRKEQISILSNFGIPQKKIRKWLFAEGIIIAAAGVLLGILLAVYYNKIVFSALNTIWNEIVRTDVLSIDIKFTSLLAGGLITFFISVLTIYFPLNKFLKSGFRQLQSRNETLKFKSHRGVYQLLSVITGLAGLFLLGLQFINREVVNESVFFLAGGLFLISGLTAFYSKLKLPISDKPGSLSFFNLAIRNLHRNPVRSLIVVILFSLGSFLVLTTGSNRKDLFKNADSLSSGTGGYLFYSESTAPVLYNLNLPEVRYEFGLDSDYEFVQFRKSEGDDASCLNLNKISTPTILGVDPEKLEGRFSFVTSTDFLDENSPWKSLNRELSSRLVPAIADETVIKWSLGMKVGDTLKYLDSNGEELNLLLIGGLAPSIFQGNVIIADKNFLKAFPENSGTKVFLIDGDRNDSTEIFRETSMGLRDFGWDIQLSAARLSEFNSVTNTYLTIFMVLGALGLLLGTIGLAVVLFRSMEDRKQEFAVLRALGFKIKKIKKYIRLEFFSLLIIGSGIGFISAVISTLPALISEHSGSSFKGILLIMLLLLLNGFIWIYGLTAIGLKQGNIIHSLRND